MPIAWQRKGNDNMLAFFFMLFLNADVNGTLIFKLYWIEFYLKAGLIINSFKPVSYMGLWNLDKKDSFCHSLQFRNDVFDFKIDVAQRVMECDIGVLSMISMTPQPNWLECTWSQLYVSKLPLWKISFFDEADWFYDIMPMNCLNTQK